MYSEWVIVLVTIYSGLSTLKLNSYVGIAPKTKQLLLVLATTILLWSFNCNILTTQGIYLRCDHWFWLTNMVIMSTVITYVTTID